LRDTLNLAERRYAREAFASAVADQSATLENAVAKICI
jgi:hypothetical protein